MTTRQKLRNIEKSFADEIINNPGFAKDITEKKEVEKTLKILQQFMNGGMYVCFKENHA